MASAPRSDQPEACEPKPRPNLNSAPRPVPANGPRLLDAGLEAPRSSDC